MFLAAFAQNGFSIGDTFLGKAGVVLNLILLADEFFNGGDPPQKRRRRAKIKKTFARLAPARTS
jgi:hypothetical protein